MITNLPRTFEYLVPGMRPNLTGGIHIVMTIWHSSIQFRELAVNNSTLDAFNEYKGCMHKCFSSLADEIISVQLFVDCVSADVRFLVVAACRLHCIT